jgi:thiol:disulfide interchange protein DsbD
MVPVTVSYFTKRTDRPLASALAYAGGIIGTFAVLGVGVAALFGATRVQAFATNPWVNLGLGLLFVVLALNLFGVYEFQVPLANRFASASRSAKGGLVAPVLMAVAFTLTSFTCTAPIVGTLLALSAKGGNLVYPMLGMASFGLAFALPFFLLALFPSLLSKTPKAGSWLGVVKPTLGFIELMASLKFFSNSDLVWQTGILTRPVFLVLWAGLSLAMGLYLAGAFAKFKGVGPVRIALGLAGCAFGIWLIVGVRGGDFGQVSAYLPPDPYPAKGASHTLPSSLAAADPGTAKTFQAALDLAKEKHANVFVNFTGITCVNCRTMENTVFPRPDVQKEFGKLVKVELYTDRDTDEDNANQALEQKIGNTVALPLYLIVRPDGTVIDRFEGLAPNPVDFVQFLKKGTARLAMR